LWTARYHEADPAKRAFGGRINVRLKDGRAIAAEKAAADAHPNGARPWRWADYAEKFETLAGELLDEPDRRAFLAAAQEVATLSPAELDALVPAAPPGEVNPAAPTGEGIFDFGFG
jgi:2-methylcitrate dehydratase